MKYASYILIILFSFALTGFAQSEKKESASEGKKVIVKVDGMACPFCAFGVEKKLERLEGVQSLNIKINEGQVVLLLKKDATLDTVLVKQKITEAGFTPRKVEIEEESK